MNDQVHNFQLTKNNIMCHVHKIYKEKSDFYCTYYFFSLYCVTFVITLIVYRTDDKIFFPFNNDLCCKYNLKATFLTSAIIISLFRYIIQIMYVKY